MITKQMRKLIEGQLHRQEETTRTLQRDLLRTQTELEVAHAWLDEKKVVRHVPREAHDPSGGMLYLFSSEGRTLTVLERVQRLK